MLDQDLKIKISGAQGWKKTKIPNRLLEYKVKGRRRFEWPRSWWEECVWRDIQKLGVKN
jgi:hypothetical protein